jgi:hypothetical protein
MAAPTTAAPAAAYEFSQPPAAVPAKRVPYREPVTAPTLYVGGDWAGGSPGACSLLVLHAPPGSEHVQARTDECMLCRMQVIAWALALLTCSVHPWASWAGVWEITLASSGVVGRWVSSGLCTHQPSISTPPCVVFALHIVVPLYPGRVMAGLLGVWCLHMSCR